MSSTQLPGGRRRSIRLRSHDYTTAGGYFLTLCTKRRVRLFGGVVNGRVRLSRLGALVHDEWLAIPSRRRGVAIDAFVVMPDHFHAILILEPRPNEHFGHDPRRPGPGPGSVGAIVAQFKAGVTRRARERLGRGNQEIWHRNYWDDVIRNTKHLNNVRQYVDQNPARWRDRG